MFSLPTLATSFIENGGAKVAAMWAAVVGIKYVIRIMKDVGKTDKYGTNINEEWKRYKRGLGQS